MPLDNTTSLAIAELIIYIILWPVALYILIKHGKHGILAWFYLVTFDALRIVPAAMQIAAYAQSKPESEVASILDAVGLSPLILCAAGVLHEIQHYLAQTGNAPVSIVERIIQVSIHAVTIVGVVLSAYGAAQLYSTSSHDVAQDHAFVEAGGMLLLLALILLVYVTVRLFGRTRSVGGSIFQLYMSVVVALIPIAVRVFYGVVYAFDRSPSLSPYSGTFAIKLVLVFLMLLLAGLALMAGGLASRNVVREYAGRGDHEHITYHATPKA